MKQYLSCFAMISLFAWMSASIAQVPAVISYQGFLSDTLGNPQPDAGYPLTFRLYEEASGGTAIWSESKTLQTRRGLFQTLLGDRSPLAGNVGFDKPYWLSISLNNEPEFSPRIPLSSVGYSFHSATADTAEFARVALNASGGISTIQSGDNILDIQAPNGPTATVTLKDQSISSTQLADNAITAAKVLPDILSSINGLSNDGGNINLVAGAGILIEPDPLTNTINIGASAIIPAANRPIFYTGNLISLSDARLKTGIQPLSGSLQKIMQLKAYRFNFSRAAEHAHLGLPAGEQFGFKTGEFEGVLPELVRRSAYPVNKQADSEPPIEELEGIEPLGLMPLLVEALQEQQRAIEAQQQAISALKKRIESLESR